MTRRLKKQIASVVVFLIMLSVCECVSINKCCENGERLNADSICVSYNATETDLLPESILDRFTEYNFTVKSNQMPSCYSEYIHIKNENNSLSENGTYEAFYPNGNIRAEYTPSTFCLDQIETEDEITDIAYVCPCMDHICIFKCCPMEKHLEYTYVKSKAAGFKCASTVLDDWHYTILNGSSLKETTHAINKVPTCAADEHFLTLEGTYYLQENGSIFSEYDGTIIPTDYCGDYIQENETRTSTIVACIPFLSQTWHIKMYACLSIIGVFFLILTIFLHLWLPELAGNPADCLVAHASCLVVGYICTPTNQFLIDPDYTFQCYFVGYLMQYTYLASFFWLNIICFGMSWQFSRMTKSRLNKRNQESSKFLWQSLYAWTSPALITMTTLALDLAPGIPKDSIFKPNFGITKCWFFENAALHMFFNGPMGILVIVNTIFFSQTLWRIYLLRKGSDALEGGDSQTSAEQKKSYVMYMKIFLLMGVSWIMEVVSSIAGGPAYVWVLTDSFNILRAVLIFIIFCCKPNVWQALKKKKPTLEKITFLDNYFSAPVIPKPPTGSPEPSTGSTSSGKYKVEMTPN